MNIKEDDLLIRIVGANDEKGKSPSVEDSFKDGKIFDFYDFVQECEDLAESQNGYFLISDANGMTFKGEFFTFDDTNNIDGIRTGFVLFEAVAKPTKETMKAFEF